MISESKFEIVEEDFDSVSDEDFIDDFDDAFHSSEYDERVSLGRNEGGEWIGFM